MSEVCFCMSVYERLRLSDKKQFVIARSGSPEFPWRGTLPCAGPRQTFAVKCKCEARKNAPLLSCSPARMLHSCPRLLAQVTICFRLAQFCFCKRRCAFEIWTCRKGRQPKLPFFGARSGAASSWRALGMIDASQSLRGAPGLV